MRFGIRDDIRDTGSVVWNIRYGLLSVGYEILDIYGTRYMRHGI